LPFHSIFTRVLPPGGTVFTPWGSPPSGRSKSAIVQVQLVAPLVSVSGSVPPLWIANSWLSVAPVPIVPKANVVSVVSARGPGASSTTTPGWKSPIRQGVAAERTTPAPAPRPTPTTAANAATAQALGVRGVIDASLIGDSGAGHPGRRCRTLSLAGCRGGRTRTPAAGMLAT
jgi:hypothetical protein